MAILVTLHNLMQIMKIGARVSGISLNDSFSFNHITVLEPREDQLEVIGIREEDNYLYRLKKSRHVVEREVDCSLSVPFWDAMIKPSIVTLQARLKERKNRRRTVHVASIRRRIQKT